ncbi:accessory gland protein Acp53Ea [Drosophila kikkawai]|uniref:Accessory gland protein Acp53Ea n=1 Tax=Drosophila kikkawai TaxID=30033 RepID=A0A6P4I691_DROKI|nr:uncharacterized protein LOC108076199 [Drosophila kikkawai]
MHFIKIAFLLSFLALCHKHQAEAAIGQKLDKYLTCAEVVTDCAAQLIENSVSSISVLADCVDFKPTLKRNGSIIRIIRLAYQFIQKSVVEKQNCVVSLFYTAVNLIKPYIAKFDQLKCLA